MQQGDLFAQSGDEGESLLPDLLHRAELVLVKKLSNNDRDWAQLTHKHQGGVYMPPAQRDGGFFPPLVAKEREPGADEIRETFFRTEWPQYGEAKEDTRLVHYTSKGAETHMTRLPKAAFAQLSPASFLVMARLPGAEGTYSCLTIDAASDEASVLRDIFALPADFVIGEFEPQAHLAAERARIIDFAEEVIAAWLAGSIADFAQQSAAMPATAVLAERARVQFLATHGLADLNPFDLECPGDAVRDISRNIEWELFRTFQRRERAVALVRIILGDEPGTLTPQRIIRSLVDNIGEVDRLMLSASQQRKSRAGYSFEHHIEAMLTAGSVPFAKQVVMDAKKRPDFVLPSLKHLRKPPEGSAPGLILSAKTTLRERWKQVQREMVDGRLFLATVDESIAANAIEDMRALDIILVVPEALRTSTSTEYVRHANVISFKGFFEDVLGGRHLPVWMGT